MIELIDTTCTRCGQPMRLPAHVAGLPARARLCAVCVRALLRAVAEAETITLPNGTVLAVGDECLAGHPLTLRFRKATIVGVIQTLGEQYARVRGARGEEWDVIRHGLRRLAAAAARAAGGAGGGGQSEV